MKGESLRFLFEWSLGIDSSLSFAMKCRPSRFSPVASFGATEEELGALATVMVAKARGYRWREEK